MEGLKQLVSYIWICIEKVFEYLECLYSPFGLSFITLALGAAMITALFNYVLSPYLTGSGSDKANKKDYKKGK